MRHSSNQKTTLFGFIKKTVSRLGAGSVEHSDFRQIETDPTTNLFRLNGRAVRLALTTDGLPYFLEGTDLERTLCPLSISVSQDPAHNKDPASILTRVHGIVPSEGSRPGAIALTRDKFAERTLPISAFFLDDGSFVDPSGNTIVKGMADTTQAPRCRDHSTFRVHRLTGGCTYGNIPIIGAVTSTRFLSLVSNNLPNYLLVHGIEKEGSSTILNGRITGHPYFKEKTPYRSRPVLAYLLANGGIVTGNGWAIPNPAPWTQQVIPSNNGFNRLLAMAPTTAIRGSNRAAPAPL